MALAPTDVPSIAHHEFKVVVIVDGSAHVLVVLQEFVERDRAVRIGIIVVHEELESLSRGSFTPAYSRVLRDIVGSCDLVHSDDSRTILVENIESSLDPVHAERVHV